MTTTTNADPDHVTLDLYRGVHKGLRRVLFGLCEAAGALDPDDRSAREAFAARFADVDLLLTAHHEHEDGGALGELIARHAGAYVDEMEAAHEAIVGDFETLREAVIGLGSGGTDPAKLYDQLVAFVAGYLDHMEVEERGLMPVLAAAASFDELLAVQVAIRSTIPPQEMCVFMRAMLPAMNPDERTGMLGGMKENAPADVFDLFWATAGEVLTPEELAVVAARIESQ